MTLTAATTKPCEVCKRPFAPFSSTAKVCGYKCAKRVPIIARKATKVRLAELKPLSHWRSIATTAFNAWVRARDRSRPCISCGTTTGAWDAGHYLSTGAYPELRFEPLNCHKQCVQCNQHLSGNLVRYRQGLIAKIGIAYVEWLEGPHEPKQYRAEDLKAITADYRARLKALTK